jgi:hypothetical protein
MNAIAVPPFEGQRKISRGAHPSAEAAGYAASPRQKILPCPLIAQRIQSLFNERRARSPSERARTP